MAHHRGVSWEPSVQASSRGLGFQPQLAYTGQSSCCTTATLKVEQEHRTGETLSEIPVRLALVCIFS